MTDGDRERVIAVEHLSTYVGGQWVHRDLSLNVYRGEILGLIGTAGSGKSVLLQHIIGMLRPQQGTIKVLGEDLHALERGALTRLRQRWGVMFQQGALFSALNIYNNIAFPLRELRKQGEKIEESTIHMLVRLKLHMVGLEPETAWKYPSQLSGGMVKRAALARALALEAELLFLDEPTTGLDPISANEFDTLLIQFRKELELTALMITHDLNSLAALSDRIAVLDQGQLLTVGTLQEIAAVDHPFIRDFFQRRQGEEALRGLPSN